MSGIPGVYQEPEPKEINPLVTRAAKKTERLAAQHARRSRDEKILETRLYPLKGTGGGKRWY